MPRKQSPRGRSPDLAPLLATLTQASRELRQLHTDPTDAQRRAKSVFWSVFRDGSIPAPTQVDLATALRYVTQEPHLRDWWSLPGFPEWFGNSREFAERISWLETLALDSLEDILRSKQVSPQSILTAAKLVLEISDRVPRGRSTAADTATTSDTEISSMSKEQLREFIQSRVTKLLPASTDTPSTQPTTQVQHESDRK